MCYSHQGCYAGEKGLAVPNSSLVQSLRPHPTEFSCEGIFLWEWTHLISLRGTKCCQQLKARKIDGCFAFYLGRWKRPWQSQRLQVHNGLSRVQGTLRAGRSQQPERDFESTFWFGLYPCCIFQAKLLRKPALTHEMLGAGLPALRHRETDAIRARLAHA